MSDQKARDIIDELVLRDVCGAATQERVGRRAWDRPRVAVSGRLYRQYRVPDPWDPNTASDETPLGLGPVSLRLGEKKRQPAPHLKPKPTQKEKEKARQARAQQRPPRLPDVPKAETKPKTPADAKPGSAKAAKKEAEAARAAEVAAKMRAAEAARGPRPVRQLSRAETRAAKARSAVPIPTRPDLDGREDDSPESVSESSEEAAAQVPAHQVTKRSQGGRFRMPRAAASRSPIVRSQTVRELEKERANEPETPAAPPPRQRTMPSIGGGSMDDLFGAAAQMGRVSLRPRKDEPGEEKPEDE